MAVNKSNKNDHETDEIKLIKAARRDPRVFGELYKIYVNQIFRYLYSRIGNLPEAEDATSKTFLAAFEAFDKFRQDGHSASWLFAIARNQAMDHYRQRKTPVSVDEIEELSVENDPLTGIIQSEQTAALARLIQESPWEDQELLRLRFLGEMSFPEIAHILHSSEEAVKKKTYRLLARLHSQLEVSNE
jgi:RNA polymerase sigma-70 factor (ECF subfamily)